MSPAPGVLPEAALFVLAEQVLLEVLGRVRRQDADVVLPPFVDGDRARGMARVVQAHVLRDTRLPHELGVPWAWTQPERRGARAGVVAAEAACRAVLEVRDGDAVLAGVVLPVPARQHVLAETVHRALLAHHVAAHLGSTACPLPEELARPLWELTAPQAGAWRRRGWFHDPLPLPPQVSWRDRFLLTAGHPAHPVPH